ncbi:DJ-1/PfpI family protein [Photobacterium atrarenae]|uniref:DJ-1/PfpI family protein n=1 Tax=Photobacterium atrarenae TaxID=865757 RepID=A0ABY5GKD2_9GAMM|nr:DJ-1/PfpI family protein [Photobacterium atrarenae]UTV29169.1 DJ-1/PfpI family protein [Photobacterium atrarenae]
MYQIAIVLFDEFTDVDFFLMRDVFGRSDRDWQVRVLGTKASHISTLGIEVQTDGHISQANMADAVLFVSGYKGVPAVLEDPDFMGAFHLNPEKQLIGSICAGSFILYRLGLLEGRKLTTHPDAKPRLEDMGATVEDKALVVDGNIATAGGCLSSMYLTGWIAERLCGEVKRREIHRQLLPAGQAEMFDELISSSIQSAIVS